MKAWSILLSLISLQIALQCAQAQTMAYQYSCKSENGPLQVTLLENKANLTFFDLQGNPKQNFSTILDPTYVPTKNVKFTRYLSVDASKPVPYFLISKSMTKGSSKGSVNFHQRSFSCKRSET